MHKLRDSNYGHPLGAPSKGKVSEMLPAFLTMTMHCNQDRAQNPSEHLKGYFLYCPVTQNVTLKTIQIMHLVRSSVL